MEVLSGLHNQARFFFEDGQRHEHHGLVFRSRTEIKIFEALMKRHVLFCPLPVAVMGNVGVYREPDFLVFYKGRSGIIEIHGQDFHPPETAAIEHIRRRRFIDLGINEFEIYDTATCYNEPERVVQDFLRRLERKS